MKNQEACNCNEHHFKDPLQPYLQLPQRIKTQEHLPMRVMVSKARIVSWSPVFMLVMPNWCFVFAYNAEFFPMPTYNWSSFLACFLAIPFALWPVLYGKSSYN